MKSTIKTELAVILLVAVFFAPSLNAQQQPKRENAAAQFLPKAFGMPIPNSPIQLLMHSTTRMVTMCWPMAG